MFPDRDQAGEQSHRLPEYFQKQATSSFTGQVNTILGRLCLSSCAWVEKEQFSVSKKSLFSALSCLPFGAEVAADSSGLVDLPAEHTENGVRPHMAQNSCPQYTGKDVPTQKQRLKSHQRLLLMLKNRRGNGCKTPFLMVPFINFSMRQFLWARQEKLGS